MGKIGFHIFRRLVRVLWMWSAGITDNLYWLFITLFFVKAKVGMPKIAPGKYLAQVMKFIN